MGSALTNTRCRAKMEQKIQLQGVGLRAAKPASEFKVGEFFVWNYGYHSEIVGIKKVTKHQIVFLTQSQDGEIYERRLGKSRLVGIGNRTAFLLNSGKMTINEYLELKRQGVEAQ